MTQEEKAKRYDKALESIKELYSKGSRVVVSKEEFENIFPELKESEEERIRNVIRGWIYTRPDSFFDGGISKEEMLAWLEKQGDSPIKWNKSNEGNKPQINHSVLMKTTHGIAEGEWKGEYWYQYRWSSTVNDSDVLSWMELSDLEKQGEQKSTLPKWKYKKDHTPLLRDSIILNRYGGVAKSPSGAIVSDVWVLDYGELAKLPKEEIEKQGEQKSIFYFNANDWYVSKVDGKIHNIYHSEVEPKFNFKVGQWIVATGKCVYLITKIDGFNVTLVDTIGNEYVFDVSSLADAHLWTIQDATDGDVLNANGAPFIYKKHDKDCVYFYCGVNLAGEFVEANEFDIWNNNNNKVYPAIKEQRDLLFQKMKDAGYKWDEEKKEVKIIEWNNIVRDSIFDEDIDIPFGTCDSKPYYQEIYIPDGFQATIEGRKIILKKEENKL